MIIKVTASHVSERWQLTGQDFIVGTSSAYCVKGDDQNGYYAKAPDFGCGKTRPTPQAAIESLLWDNGCTNVQCVTVTESDQGAALAQSPVDYIAAIPATLETLQEAEFWHGYLMAESLRMAAGNRSPSEYDQARRRYYDALRASGLTGSAVDQMLRDTRASVLFAHTDGDTVERGEYTLTATVEYDHDHGAPWQECDGHGPVSEWTTRDKLPGELVLCSDRGRKRYYDYAEACRIARAECWGLTAAEHDRAFGARRIAVKSRYGESNGMRRDTITEWRDVPAVTPTKRQIAAAAARADYEYLRKWCNDQWHYVGVIVTVTDQNGDQVAQESLWGIESHATEYLLETAESLAQQALDGLA